MKIKGNVFVFGDNVNTDEIIPARYLSTHDPAELALYCMEDSRPGFGKQDNLRGSLMVAGDNFGCGSSREHAPLAIKASGIQCVIARSFARIFLRNGINIGLPLVAIPELPKTAFTESQKAEIDIEAGCVRNCAGGREFTFLPYPPFLRDIIHRGGWLNYAKEVLMKETK